MLEQIFNLGDLSKNNPNFNGDIYLKELTSDPIRVTNVTFAEGVRNNWHIHHKVGQILLVTAGFGWYQEWGKPAQALKAGDVVNIPAEIKHWHGAQAEAQFAHIAISPVEKSASTEWLEPIADSEFFQLKD